MTDMVQCGMAVSGYPNMENIPPAQDYSAPPRVAVPPLLHHPQQQQSPAYSHRQQPLSPNYPPPVSPNSTAAATVYPQPRVLSGGRGPALSPGPPVAAATAWSNGTNGASDYQTTSSHQPPPPSSGRPLVRNGGGGPHATLFRPMVLETRTWYSVFISANEAGPADFSLQLASLSQQLETVMADINSCQLRPLAATAVQVGVACLARYSADSTIYRAVILQRAETVKVPGTVPVLYLVIRCSVYVLTLDWTMNLLIFR